MHRPELGGGGDGERLVVEGIPFLLERRGDNTRLNSGK